MIWLGRMTGLLDWEQLYQQLHVLQLLGLFVYQPLLLHLQFRLQLMVGSHGGPVWDWLPTAGMKWRGLAPPRRTWSRQQAATGWVG